MADRRDPLPSRGLGIEGGICVALEECMAEWTQSAELHASSASTQAAKGGRVHPQRDQVPRDPLHAGSAIRAANR